MESFLYKIKHPMKMVLVGKRSDAGKRLRSSVRLSDCGKQCALCRAHRDVYNVKCALYTQWHLDVHFLHTVMCTIYNVQWHLGSNGIVCSISVHLVFVHYCCPPGVKKQWESWYEIFLKLWPPLCATEILLGKAKQLYSYKWYRKTQMHKHKALLATTFCFVKSCWETNQLYSNNWSQLEPLAQPF